jgi:hypothetical protein
MFSAPGRETDQLHCNDFHGRRYADATFGYPPQDDRSSRLGRGMEGWKDGRDFHVRSNDTSYVTHDIFKEYLTIVFLRYVESVRTSLDLNDFPAVLLCDNCFSHSDDEIMQILASHNVKLLTFPPHTSNLFQPLDLVTSGIFKCQKREIQMKLPAGSQVWHITRLMKVYE